MKSGFFSSYILGILELYCYEMHAGLKRFQTLTTKSWNRRHSFIRVSWLTTCRKEMHWEISLYLWHQSYLTYCKSVGVYCSWDAFKHGMTAVSHLITSFNRVAETKRCCRLWAHRKYTKENHAFVWLILTEETQKRKTEDELIFRAKFNSMADLSFWQSPDDTWQLFHHWYMSSGCK